MTTASLARRLRAVNLDGVVVGLILLLFAIAAGLLAFGARPERASAEPLRVTLPPVEAAAMVAATSAGSAEIRAMGEQAQLINAALPFSSSPLQASRPFAIEGGLDHRRALLCLTQAVYYEAGFEPMAGRRAVAQVVLNRMRHPAFPKSVCGVVYQGASSPVCQFSFVCDGSLHRAPAQAAWRQAEQVAQAALGGYVEQSVGAATHYHADYVAPRWAPKLTKLTKLGAHIFYRWPGGWGHRAAFTGRYIGEPSDPAALKPELTGEQLADLADPAIAGGPVTDGTVLKRAPNDVGGLLDTSKGWTLTIPDPANLPAAARTIAAQQKPEPKSTAAPIIASR